MVRMASATGIEKPKKRHAEMIAAAAQVFARRGYHGASTQDIADVLGIRQASLYYYFESKEAALEAVCAEGIEDYALHAQRILRGKERGADRSEEHTSELQSPCNLVCRLLLEKKKK